MTTRSLLLAGLLFCFTLTNAVGQDRDRSSAAGDRRRQSQSWIAKGKAQFLLGHDKQALSYFEKAVAADPKYPRALALRGLSRAMFAYYGYPEKSVIYSREDVAGRPNSRRYGYPYWDLGRPVFALSSPEEMRRRRADFKEALRDVENAVQADRVDAESWLCRGIVYLFRSDLAGFANADKAIEDLKQAIVLDEELADAHYYQAWAYLKSIRPRQWDRVRPFISLLNGKKAIRPADKDRADQMVRQVASRIRLVQKATSAAAGGRRFIMRTPEKLRTPFLTAYLFVLDPQVWLDKNARERATPKALPPAEFFQRARNAVVLIRTPGSLGSGFLPHTSRFILTNEHVVRGAVNREVKVHFFNGTVASGRVVKTDRRRDLAAIRMARIHRGMENIVPSGPFQVASAYGHFNTRPGIGSRVHLIGHPKGLRWTVTSGVFSSRRTIQGVSMIQTDVAMNPGNSGGPLIDKDGNIVGMAQSILKKTEGLNFAVSGAEVLKFYRSVLGF